MKIEALLTFQVAFSQAPHAACSGLDGVQRWPVEKLAKWDPRQLQDVADLALVLEGCASACGDDELAAALLAVRIKTASAVKRAKEDKKMKEIERRDDERRADMLPYEQKPKGDTA